MVFDLKDIMQIVYRSIICLLTLFLITKVLGKRQIGNLSFYDYIIGLTIGSIAADIIINLEYQLVNGIFSILIYGFIGYLLSLVSIKSFRVSKIINGVPTILVQDGKFLIKNFKKPKIPLIKFLELCRVAGYYDASDISYAILETNGALSILRKGAGSLCSNIIVDGVIMTNHLKELGKTKKWLKTKLKDLGYTKISEIFLATLDNKNNLKVFLNNREVEEKELLEY